MIWPSFTKETTPGQFLVFVGFVAVVLLLIGGYLIYLSFGQPPEKLELAREARSWGIGLVISSIVTGALTALGKRLVD
jgi:hypothetical protein